MIKRVLFTALVMLMAVGVVVNAQNKATAKGVTEVVIEPVGDQMKYATTEFTVKSGDKVKLFMNNTATSPAMKHNVVILKPDSDIQKIGMAAVQAGEKAEYIPKDDAILFYTKMAGPGEKTTVEFTAPAPGKYPFICTFPGHFALMKGIMIVK